MSTRTTELVRATGRQYLREPANLFLLVLIPPLFVIAMSSSISTFSDVIGGNVGVRAGTALAAVWAASLLAGISSFFLLRSSVHADARLILAGMAPRALYAAYAVAAAGLALLTATVSFAMVAMTREISEPLTLWAAIFVGALVYETLGLLLAFFIRGDIEGSFVFFLVFMFDAFVAGPLGGGQGLIANLFPLHFTSQIALSAMIGSGYDASWFAWSAAYAGLFVGTAMLLSGGWRRS